MTQIPVAGLYTQLSLDPTELAAGIQQAKAGLSGLRSALKDASAGAASAGAAIDKGLAGGMGKAASSSKLLGVEFQKLKGRMDPLAGAFTKLDREAAKLDSQLKRGVISAEQHTSAMQALKTQGLSAVSAETDRLRMKFDPLYASSKRYESAVMELNRALDTGAIKQGNYDTALEGLNTQLASGATYFGRASGQAQQFNATAGAMSSQTGNIAAQFQDIGVQFAGGQSPFLIALQQGTQLNGVFSQMGGNLGTVAKGLGGALMSLVSPLSLITIGAIAAGGALVQWAMSAGEASPEAEALAASIEKVTAAQKALTEATSAAQVDIDKLRFGVDEEYQVELLREQLRLKQEYTAKALELNTYLATTTDSIDRQRIATADVRAELEKIADAYQDNVALLDQQAERSATLSIMEGVRVQRANEVTAKQEETARAMENMERLMASLAGMNISGPWQGVLGSIQSAINRAREYAAVSQMPAGLEAVKTQGLAEQYAQYGAGRVAFDQGARESSSLYTPFTVPAASGDGVGGGRSAVDDLARDVERLNESARAGLAPIDKYRDELAKLDKLKAKGLSDAAYSQEIEKLNKELAESNPLVNDVADAFGDFVARGFKDFKGFAQSVIGSFKKMLADMISMAVKNRIMIGLGFSGGGGIGGAAMAGVSGGGGGLGGLGGLGGIGGGLLGSFGGAGGILGMGGLGGGAGLLGGLGNAISGGLGNILNIGANAAAAGGGLMAGIGSALPLVAGIALVFSAFRKKVTQLDSGVRVTTTGMDSLVETFSKIKTTRFFGLSKKISTSFKEASEEIADPVLQAVSGLQQGAIDAAKTLGVTSDAFRGFSHEMTVSTKGLSEADAQKAIEAALTDLGDAFAGMVPGLRVLQKEGEGALAALSRISSSLMTVNDTFVDLGLQLFDVSVAGGGAASAFADLLGGLEGFTQTTAAYYANFFTEGERVANVTRRMTDAFGDLGLQLPDTREAFRALVEAADAAGERDLVAGLLKLSPAFAQISEGAEDTVARINQALADLRPEDFATALDFNRARGLLSGTAVSTAPNAAAAVLAATTPSAVDATSETLSSINTNIALLRKMFQKFDIDGMPAVRT